MNQKIIWSLLVVCLAIIAVGLSLRGVQVGLSESARTSGLVRVAFASDSQNGDLQSPQPQVAPASEEEQFLKNYGQLPLSFESNRGQSNAEVRFISRGSGYSLFLTPSEAVLVLNQPATHGEKMRTRVALKKTSRTTLRFKLVDANPTPHVTGEGELAGKVNYFIGHDPTEWRTDVPTYAKVKYKDVYSGVDMVYYGNQRQLEYDLVVAQGTDPGVIALRIEGSKAMTLNSQGDLELAGRELVMRKPDIYQEIDGVRKAVQGGYKLKGPHEVGFQVGDYDATRPLVIDPVLVYSTYLGGTGADHGNGIAVDSAGNAYIVGTASNNFPTLNPFQAAYSGSGGVGGAGDAFVAKLNPSGNALVYSTYLGGSGGDNGNGIALDGGGNVYVAGITASTNFPTMNPYQATFGGGSGGDGYVTKLNAAGNALLYSTYLGGSMDDNANAIAVNVAGHAYVTGVTSSTNFPTINSLQGTLSAGQDAFVVKLGTGGNTLVYSTYLGGGSSDVGNGIVVDGAGNTYVTGYTYSTNFPTMNPYQATFGGQMDAFTAKLNAAGNALVFSTYLGGVWYDRGNGIAVDGAGNAYVTGTTGSNNFPTLNPYKATISGMPDAFVAKLNASGTVVYSTYLGGSGGNYGNSIVVDALGNAYVTGITDSSNFPTVNPYQGANGGADDAYLTKVNAAGNALTFSTYQGGGASDYGRGVALDGAGNVYIAGTTRSTNFPTVNPYQATYNGGTDVYGGGDAFVAKIGTPTACVNPPNTTMVAWYPFDETLGTMAANLAAGNHGTLINSPTHIPGKVAGALRFDGINDYVESPSTLVTNIGPAGLPQTCSGSYSTCPGDFSIDAWINVHPAASISVIAITDKRSGTVPAINGYLFFVYQRNKLGLQLADGAGSFGYTNYFSPVISGLAGNWHHVAVTVSRRSLGGIKWYVDGVLIGSSSPNLGVTRFGSLVNNSPLRIGADSYLGARFKGDIDELEIFNRGLTPAEVQGIYNAGASGKCK